MLGVVDQLAHLARDALSVVFWVCSGEEKGVSDDVEMGGGGGERVAGSQAHEATAYRFRTSLMNWSSEAIACSLANDMLPNRDSRLLTCGLGSALRGLAEPHARSKAEVGSSGTGRGGCRRFQALGKVCASAMTRMELRNQSWGVAEKTGAWVLEDGMTDDVGETRSAVVGGRRFVPKIEDGRKRGSSQWE